MSTQPSSLQEPNPNPTTPVFDDDLEWITAYLKIHALSHTTWRYAYFLWVIIGLVALIFALCSLLRLQWGVLGAYWSKWSLRRRTWRKKHSLAQAKKSGQPHKQPLLLHSNAQLLTLVSLTLVSLGLIFIGPDYIAPSHRLWLFHRSSGPDVAEYIPQYTVHKAWWSSGNRAGLIAFALFPLCVLFALKRPPFAIFAVPFFTNLHSDKLIWLHRWIGRLIWALVALHATFWSVQLFKDRRSGTDDIAYVYAWHYPKFRYAWTAFVFFTLLILLSLAPIRDKYYDRFYALHIILVPATLIMSALHHPPLWWWCWFALLLWAGERSFRAITWLYLNGFLGGHLSISPIDSTGKKVPAHGQGWEMHSIFPDVESVNSRSPFRSSLAPPPKRPLYHHLSSSTHSLLPPGPSTFSIPPGYAHAEILAGRTIRLRIITPGHLTWAPGQHFSICIPCLSKFNTHPFTCASVCDKQKPGNDGRMIVFLIRAKNGWTKELWTTVVGLLAHEQRHPAGEVPPGTMLPPTGVLLKAWVDGPFGSPARTDWGMYSTAVIVCGGSGASFAISVLEYLCLCMAGRDGQSLGGTVGRYTRFSTRRIRFVWILRDFAHLQWCASVLYRCHSLVPPEALQLDLFVTNFNPPVSQPLGLNNTTSSMPFGGAPDTSFSSATISTFDVKGVELDQTDLIDAQMPEDDYVDLSYYTGGYTENGELGHEEHQLDLTNFDGDNDDRVPGEGTLSRAVKKEGTMRRAITRKKKESRRTKRAPETRGVDSKTLPDLPTVPMEAGKPQMSPPARLEADSTTFGGDTPGWHQAATRSSRLSVQSLAPSTQRAPSPLGWDVSESEHGEASMGHAKRLSTASVASHAPSMQSLMRETIEEPQLELGEQEMRDISIMAEFARPGRPKVDLILRDEVEMANGRIVLACCGPTTLNAVVRKAVAAQINPSRLKQGDNSGSIDVVVEEFGF